MAGESTQEIEQEMLFDIPSNYQSPFPENSADIAEVDYETDENEESNGKETDDSDSTFSDGFEDSDFEYDDVLYDENIDKEIEWVGINDESVKELEKGKGIIEYQATEYFRSLSKSHSSAKAKSSKYQIYKDDADESDFEFEVGLCFKTATDFREAVRKYSNKQGRPISFKKNCSDKVQAICACGWVIYASFISKIDNTFQVKSIKREHTCSRDPSSKHCTSIFLAKKYQHHLRSNPEWPAGSMQEIMQMENHTSLSIWKMYRAKKHATKLNQGTELEQYANLCCRKWDISGIPCVHATTCIFYRRENVEDYVEHWYRKDTFFKAYSHMLNPLKGQKEWPDSTLNTLVPWYEKPKKAGRPLKHARRKESDESSQKQVTGKRNGPKYSCSKCGKLGHNKKGCKEASTNLSAGVSSQITKRQKLPVKRNVEKSNFVVRGIVVWNNYIFGGNKDIQNGVK